MAYGNYPFETLMQRKARLGGGLQSQLTGGARMEVPNLQDLTKKYLQGQPDYSPEKTTEGMLGRFRAEMRPAMEEAVLGAQTHAARSGQAYGDVAGRALGQAVGGMAAPLGDVVAQGTQLGTQAQMQQRAMAQEMARADATMQMEAQQFVAQLEAEYRMLDQQLRAQERIAMMNARSQEEIARIQNAGAMARTQFVQQAEQKAKVFSEQQANWRHAQQLQYLGKVEAGQQGLQRDYQTYLAAQLAQKQTPGAVPGGPTAPTIGGPAPNVGAEYGPNRPAKGTGWLTDWRGNIHTL